MRTLPSSTWLTFSSRAICGTSTWRPLYANALLREMTVSDDTLLRSVMMSSLIPSLKYSCSASPLMFANGSTQTANRRAVPGEGGAGARFPPAVPRGACRPIIAPSERSKAWNWALAGSLFQPSRSVVCIARTSIGRTAPLNLAGTSLARSAASRASPRTHRDVTEVGVHTTSTTLAAFSSASIWSSNC